MSVFSLFNTQRDAFDTWRAKNYRETNRKGESRHASDHFAKQAKTQRLWRTKVRQIKIDFSFGNKYRIGECFLENWLWNLNVIQFA